MGETGAEGGCGVSDGDATGETAAIVKNRPSAD